MRRDGGSNTFKNVVTVAVLVYILFFTPLRDSFAVKLLGQAGYMVVYPFQFVAVKTFEGGQYFVTSILTLKSAQKDNVELRRKLSVERSINNAFESLVQDNKNLRSQLSFRKSNPFGFNLIPAQIVSRSPSLWFKTAVIDKGKNDGVKVGRAVITTDGLVGRVVKTDDFSSMILFITDEDSAVSCQVKRTQDIGVIKGTGSDLLLCKYIRCDSDAKEGDEIVSSTVSEYYPKGIPVGKITAVTKRPGDLFLKLDIKSVVDFSRLEVVFVVRQE